MDKKRFLEGNKIGLVLRAYAGDESQIPNRVEMTGDFIQKALDLRVGGHQVINTVLMQVWTDPRYKSDCGGTAPAMKAKYPFQFGHQVIVNEFAHGDIFCGILNDALFTLAAAGMDYVVIASAEAHSYFNAEVFTAMIEKAGKGALAVGVAINELTESILEGRLANTLCMWDIRSLVSVGGFDLASAKPMDDKLALFVRDYGGEETKYYHLAGVEEVVPLALMVERYGKCIAPVMPAGEGVQAYIVPDPQKEPERYEQHITKLGTKLQRQTLLLANKGFTVDFLKMGLMD